MPKDKNLIKSFKKADDPSLIIRGWSEKIPA